jgi:hypothetical protein
MGMESAPKISAQKEGNNSSFAESFSSFRDKKISKLLEGKTPTLLLPKKKIILENSSVIEIAPIAYMEEMSRQETGELEVGLFGVVLIATDKENTVDGYRHICGRYDRTRKIATVSSTVAVRRTGMGVATELDRINTALLQEVSDSGDMRIVWEITNNNWKRLQLVKEKLAVDTKNIPLQIEYAQITKEQEAWLRLYGEGGSLGFTVTEKTEDGVPLSCEKVFSPAAEKQEPKQNEPFQDLLSGKTAEPDPRATMFFHTTCYPLKKSTNSKKV